MDSTSRNSGPSDPGYGQEDWDAVSDTPELTDAELVELRPAQDVPEVFALLPKRGRGRPRLPDAKVNLTLRIDPGLLAAYRATGDGWQTRMHDALAAGLARDKAESEGERLLRAAHRNPKVRPTSKAGAMMAGMILTGKSGKASGRVTMKPAGSKRPKSA